MRIAAAALVVFLTQAPVAAKITAPSIVEVGEQIVITVEPDAPPEGEYQATFAFASETMSLLQPGATGPVAYGWGRPGKHRVYAVTAVYSVNGLQQPKIESADIEVIWGVDPTPDPSTLVDLVTPEQAATLAGYYSDLAAKVAAGRFSSVPIFEIVHENARAQLDLEGVAAAYALIDKRVAAVLGDATEFTADLTGLLSSELSAISVELGGVEPGPDPEPENGPRQVIVVREAHDETEGLAQLKAELRKQDFERWLNERGHSVVWIDDDAQDPDGNPPDVLVRYAEVWQAVGLPAILVVDPASGTVLYSGRVGDAMRSDDIADLIESTGG
jgi:hypothetical protein